jgi:hypothetical protein
MERKTADELRINIYEKLYGTDYSVRRVNKSKNPEKGHYVTQIWNTNKNPENNDSITLPECIPEIINEINSTEDIEITYKRGTLNGFINTEIPFIELENQKVNIATDTDSDRRGYYGRLLVYVYIDGENFNKNLLSTGHARIYESQFSLQNEFNEEKELAQAQNIGLWQFN